MIKHGRTAIILDNTPRLSDVDTRGIHGRIHTPDPAAVARLHAAMAAPPVAIAKDSDADMNKPKLTDDEVREIHARAVAGAKLTDAVRDVVGDRISPNTVYPYFKRLNLPRITAVRADPAPAANTHAKEQARAAAQIAAKRAKRKPAPTIATAAPPPPPAAAETAVAPTAPNVTTDNVANGLDRLAAIRDLVRDIEAAGAQVSVSFTFDLHVRFER